MVSRYLASRKAQEETLRQLKRRRNTTLSKQCDTGNPKVSGFYVSERSSRSDCSSPKYESKATEAHELKVPVVIHSYVPERCNKLYEHVSLKVGLFISQTLSMSFIQ